ncbi:MBL fold metallo-hydrolase [Helicobacter anatolicus]|uniref:MBL fold metallo-hydrolase n=1 Tax=Helicobacter anatolicus TaxID=2905874 RepID=UPI001E422121|nr:MBL fold metallo-hydrolase [Helicobacter anatolicus]MCE3038199.1 MBL fold metallo-hydrolase [Helicobacter anatolicus]
MEILKQSFGIYETNCYIIKKDGKEWGIDPGVGALEWIEKECKNLQGILLTHGHFDHIFDVAKLKKKFPDVLVYCPMLDAFMLESDCFNTGITPCTPDVLIPCCKDEQEVEVHGLKFYFNHLPGHTPGCSIIMLEDCIFSGDFVFRRSIGRYDFPYSSATDMKESLQRFREIESQKDKIIYPGHGENTLLFAEQENVKFWLQRM